MNLSAKLWDFIADKYDNQGEGYQQAHRKTVKNAKKYLHPSDLVLDFGCATGTTAMEIADQVREVQGIDISSKMIYAAKGKAAEQQVQNVDFAQTTLFDQRLEAESFDVILAFGILHLLKNPRKVIQRINKLLKPGGWFVSATACIGDKKTIPTLINAILFVPIRLGLFPYLSFLNSRKLERSIVHGRFQIVETETLSFDPAGSEDFVIARFIAAKKL